MTLQTKIVHLEKTLQMKQKKNINHEYETIRYENGK